MKTSITFGILTSSILAGSVLFQPWIIFAALLGGYGLLILAGANLHHEANYPDKNQKQQKGRAACPTKRPFEINC